MHPIHLTPKPSLAPLKANAWYSDSEYTIIVGPGGAIPHGLLRASISQLTLFFDPQGRLLIGLEAYTNMEKWEQVAPSFLALSDVEAALSSPNLFDEHGIAPSVPGQLLYHYSRELRQLTIRVCEGTPTTRVRCLDCLVCGLGTHNELMEIWIQPLEMVAKSPQAHP